MAEVHQGHRFIKPATISWLRYCARCGHIPLNNPISRLVTRLGCSYEDSPRFQAWRKSGGKAVPHE